MAEMYGSMNDESQIENEIEEWCLNLRPIEMDITLNRLGLIQTGTRSARADRLFRRLRGDYTAADFARRSDDDSPIDNSLDRIEFQSVLGQSALSRRARNYINRREQNSWVTSSQNESTLAQPLRDASDRVVAATLGTFMLNYYQNNMSATPPPVTPPNINVAPVNVQVRNQTAEAQGAIRRRDLPDAMENTTQTNAENLASNIIMQENRANNLSLVNHRAPMTVSAVHAPTSGAHMTTPTCTLTTSTITTTTNRGTINTPRIINPEEDIVLCTLPNGSTYNMRREIAIEFAKMQEAIRRMENIANLPSETLGFDELQNALLQRRAASSTGVTAPQVQRFNEASNRNRVGFQDTFNLRYYDTSEHSQRAQVNSATSELPSNRNFPDIYAPNFVPQDVGPQVTVRSESGGGGCSSRGPVYQDTVPSQRYPQNTTVTSGSQQDIGRIVRSWKLQFDGSKGASVEEFIQRVDECRTLARIPDEDLLNAMTELMSGVALFWCRQSRANWRTWGDFCAAARRCYGVDPKFQQRLVVEAQTRTQGRKESVRDYIVCLLTMMSKFDEPWTVEKQLDLLHQNMLPALKQAVKRHHVDSVDRLLELTREAEDLILAERNYRPPPKPEECLLPELAYKELDEVKAPKASKVGVAAVTSEPPPNWNKMMEQFMKGFKEQMEKVVANLPKQTPPAPVKKDEAGLRPASPKFAKRVFTKTADKPKDKTASRSIERPRITPKSDKNKNKAPGQRATATCWGCSWPGYVKTDCPECSVKEQGSA